MTIDIFAEMIMGWIAIPTIFTLVGFIFGFAACIKLGVKR